MNRPWYWGMPYTDLGCNQTELRGRAIGNPHIECSSSRLQRDEEDVQKLLSTMSSDMISDPFALGDVEDGNIAHLTNIATGVVMPHDDAVAVL